MSVFIIIFMVVATVFALGTLVYVIVDTILERRSNKEPGEEKEKKKKIKRKKKRTS